MTTVEELTDRLAIRELTARYNRTIDDGDADGFADTFTPDGTLDLAGNVFRGRDAILQFVRGRNGGTVHASFDAIIDVRGDSATQLCTGFVVRRTAENPSPLLGSTGRYEDQLVRSGDAWLFESRVFTPHKPPPAAK